MAPSRFSFLRSSLTSEQMWRAQQERSDSDDSKKSDKSQSSTPTLSGRPTGRKNGAAPEPQESSNMSPQSNPNAPTKKQTIAAPEPFVSRAPPSALPDKRRRGLAYKFIVPITEQQKADEAKARAGKARPGGAKRPRGSDSDGGDAGNAETRSSRTAKRCSVRKRSEGHVVGETTEIEEDMRLAEAEKKMKVRVNGTTNAQTMGGSAKAKPQRKSKKA